MAKKALVVIVVVIVAFLAFVATRPDAYHVERSTSIAAPADVVFADVNNYENGFQRWSPWEKRDPTLKRTFSGPKDGVGAKYAWVGNKDVGSGNMTIAESKPNELVKSDLEFVEPFASKSTITMTLAKDGDKTKVTWAMDGSSGFSGKLMSVFTSMDKMIGPDFEEGLKNLDKVAVEDAKKKADAAAAAAAATPPPATEGAAPPAPAAAPAAAPGAAPAAATPPAKG